MSSPSKDYGLKPLDKQHFNEPAIVIIGAGISGGLPNFLFARAIESR